MERAKVRRKVLAARDQLSADDLAVKSELVVEKLFQLAEFQAAGTVMFYASFKSEVQTMAGIERCIKQGKRVVLPLTLAKEKMLRPYLIKDPSHDLKPGYCAIPEPDPDLAVRLNPQEIDAIIIPGSVFDQNGGRLGYGGGFYDRFLVNQAPGALRIALAFGLQVTADSLPLASHDQSVDCLVTEKKIFRFERNRTGC
ncbi:MAG: 5-formyltetrahydrofolate cyclo-ligase [Thermodesulfobacteriota bacterium]